MRRGFRGRNRRVWVCGRWWGGACFKVASAEGTRTVARTSRTSCVSHMRSDGSTFSYPFLSVDSLTRLEEVEDRATQGDTGRQVPRLVEAQGE